MLIGRGGRLWEEVARVDGPTRQAAWNAGVTKAPILVPGSPIEGREVQLVPAEHWFPIRSRVTQPPLVPVVEGL